MTTRTSEISPTARALRALDILQGRPGITATELATRLGVTERAARRYVAILREADIPVESTRGPYGGYTLGRGLRLPPLVFSATEALGLVMAALDSQHAVADPDDPVGSALGKILRVLPSNVARQAVALRETARAVPERFPAKPDADVTTELVAAVAAQRQVRLGYRTAAGNARTFEVDPWSVVVRYGRWYLLCHSHHADELRTFRIDRITSVSSSRAPSTCRPTSTRRPSWSPTSARAGSTRRTSSSSSRWRRCGRGSGRRWASCARGPDGGCELVGTTSNAEAYAGEWLAGVPLPFTVVGGDELRAAVAAVAERLTRAVSTARPSG